MTVASCLVLVLWTVVDPVTPQIDRYAEVVPWTLHVGLWTLHLTVWPGLGIGVGSEESIFVQVNKTRWELVEGNVRQSGTLTFHFILSLWAVFAPVTFNRS